LECYQVRDSESGGTSVLWREETTIERPLATPDHSIVALPVYFAIPYDCQQCDPNDTRRHWRLRVGPEKTRREDDVEFDVPVFKTSASSPQYVADPGLLAGYETVIDDATALAEGGGRWGTVPSGGDEWQFSLFRPWILIGGLVMVAACVAAIAAVAYFHWHWAWALLPALFGVLLSLGLAELLLWGSRLRVREQTVEVTAGYWPFRKTRTFAADEISGVETALEWSRETHDMFRVELISCDGHKIVLAKRMESRRIADALCTAIQKKLPTPVNPSSTSSLAVSFPDPLPVFDRSNRAGDGS
jgi:hypothetical protein